MKHNGPDDAVYGARLEAVGEHGAVGEAGGQQQQERGGLSPLQYLSHNSAQRIEARSSLYFSF